MYSKNEESENSLSRWLFDNHIDLSTQLLSKEKLGSHLSVSPRTITAWRYRYKDFPARKVGKHVRFLLPEVLEWLQQKFGV